MPEVWKQVIGWPYEVSDAGRVRRIGGSVLRPGITAVGYPLVVLSRKGVTKSVMVHRLVAEAFIPKNGYNVVNHKNGIKTDNRVENLEWIDQHGNIMHAINVLGKKNPGGKPPANRKFTDEQVLAIRSSSEGTKELAERYGVAKSTIIRIRNGRSFKSLATQMQVAGME